MTVRTKSTAVAPVSSRATRPVAPTVTSSDRLKGAAIQLFARHGIDSVSVRDIAAAASLKNAGSLNYYFRSKEELVRQIVAEVMGVADAYWKVGLDELLARKQPPDIRELVRIIVSWPVPPAGQPGVPSTARFLAMLVHTRRELLRDLMRDLGYTNYDRALAMFRAQMVGVPHVVASQRIVFFFWSSTAFLGAREAAMDSDHDEHTVWSEKDVIENFIDAMVGMLTAPVTRSATKIKKTAARR